MGADAVALARAVAVLGVGAEVVLAAQLAELDPVVGELTADRLAAAQILAPIRPLEFFHPLIGAAVRESYTDAMEAHSSHDTNPPAIRLGCIS